MSSLPIGWENRSNCMSEKDMKLGGIAATKFVDKRLSNADGSGADTTSPAAPAGSSNAYSGSSSGVYQNSDQVRDHYLRQIEQQQQQRQQQRQQHQTIGNGGADDSSPFSSSNRHGNPGSTPMFWEERQRMRQLEAEGFRNQDAGAKAAAAATAGRSLGPTAAVAPRPPSVSPETRASTTSAHVALVRVATHALDGLAGALEGNTAVDVPPEDRAAFAKAIQRAMQALAKAKK